MTSRFILALSFALAAAPAFAADYQVNLGPMPLDDETKAVIAGRGEATIHSDGKTMSVTGNFRGLPSNATGGHVLISPVTGVPGKSTFDLNIPKASSGDISGEFKLTPAQAAALRTGRLYLQLDSEKAPADAPWGPHGTLWGWIFPAHPTPGQDVPEEGHWFLPQFDTPQS
ncbi:MAG TPA: CHRD domain-containing protein [Rhizomicrobium sp.]|nr:CHRD domain-containing protein [Rhizomicrobium sp.]